MSLPSPNPFDQSTGSSPAPTTTRQTRTPSSVWGPSTLPSKRGLTLLTTQTASQTRSGASSPSRQVFPPTNNVFGSTSSIAKPPNSRHPSISGSSTHPLQTVNPLANQTRPRNSISSVNTNSLVSQLGGTSAERATVERSSSVTGVGSLNSARLGWQSQNTNTYTASSPTSAGPLSAGSGSSGQLTSLVITQLNILLSTIKEDKDKPKWDVQADKIWKVNFDVCHALILSNMLFDSSSMQTEWKSLHSISEDCYKAMHHTFSSEPPDPMMELAELTNFSLLRCKSCRLC